MLRFDVATKLDWFCLAASKLIRINLLLFVLLAASVICSDANVTSDQENIESDIEEDDDLSPLPDETVIYNQTATSNVKDVNDETRHVSDYEVQRSQDYATYSDDSELSSRTITIKGQTYTYAYTSKSFRNYNSGARYYLRNKAIRTSTSNFGYSFYRHGSHYYSDYGYRMLYPPSIYAPIYMRRSLFYFPPMFYHFHWPNRRYWNGKRPRYVCRNDNAFWPVENQTSEFVNGLAPTLDLTGFDQFLPDPFDDWRYTVPRKSKIMHLATLNSLQINKALLSSFDDANGPDMSDWQLYSVSSTNDTLSVNASQVRITALSQSGRTFRSILAYNYFVCPDGKDPEETLCCGHARAQFCCAPPPKSVTLYVTVAAFFSGVILIGILGLVIILRCCRCCIRSALLDRARAHHNRRQHVAEMRNYFDSYFAAPTEEDRRDLQCNPAAFEHERQETQAVGNSNIMQYQGNSRV